MRKLLSIVAVLLLAAGLCASVAEEPECVTEDIWITPEIKGVTKDGSFSVALDFDECPEYGYYFYSEISYDTDVMDYTGHSNLYDEFDVDALVFEQSSGMIVVYLPFGEDCDYLCDGNEAGTVVDLEFDVVGDNCDEGSIDVSGGIWRWWDDAEECPTGTDDACEIYSPGDGVVRVYGLNCPW